MSESDQDDELKTAPDGEEGGESGGSKFNAKKIVLFVVLPLFLLGGVGGGVYFTGTLDKILKKEEPPVEESTPAPTSTASGPGVFLEIPNMLVNLSGPDEQPRYLRLRVQLELKNQADLDAVQSVMPRVVDQFQTYLRELRVRDLRGSAGIYRLQMELLSRVNAAAYPIEVRDVLFQEILIQ